MPSDRVAGQLETSAKVVGSWREDGIGVRVSRWSVKRAADLALARRFAAVGNLNAMLLLDRTSIGEPFQIVEL